MPKTVQQQVVLPAPPGVLYAMYLDPAQHAAFTQGGPVTIGPRAGTPWSAFGGRIQGQVLALTPDRQIVQSWRRFEWHEDDLDSILVLTFWPEANGTRVELTQANVPDRRYPKGSMRWAGRGASMRALAGTGPSVDALLMA